MRSMGPPAELQATETMSLSTVESEVGVGEALGMLLFRLDQSPEARRQHRRRC